MEVIFSEHARGQVENRSIEEKDVLWVLFAPDRYEPTYRSRVKVQKKIGSKILTVIYAEERDTMVVITAYYL